MYSGSKGKGELLGGRLASYETIRVMQRDMMRASGMPRRGVEGLTMRAGRLAGLWQHARTSKRSCS